MLGAPYHTYGCSLHYIRLQPPLHTVAPSIVRQVQPYPNPGNPKPYLSPNPNPNPNQVRRLSEVEAAAAAAMPMAAGSANPAFAAVGCGHHSQLNV